MTHLIELEKAYEFDVYPKRDLVLVRGIGAKVWDVGGKIYRLHRRTESRILATATNGS
jgi:hypothetical protein